MDLNNAIAKADQILDEECKRPTASYIEPGFNWNAPLPERPEDMLRSLSVIYKRLEASRQQTPRQVLEHSKYIFTGDNYELLRTVFGQVNPVDRPEFVASILGRVSGGGTFLFTNSAYPFPKFKGYVCELPLIAEFCVRSGYTEQLFAALTQVTTPTVQIANIVMQLEEAIAFNFNIFSERELEQIPGWLNPLREVAERQRYSASGTVSKMVENPHYKPGREDEANQIVKSIEGIFEECEQARFWYLKGALQNTSNQDIESDKAKIVEFLPSLGFGPTMVQSLDEAEKDYRATATEFELKNALGHLRTFYEQLHFQVCHVLAEKAGRAKDEKLGQALTSLRVLGFFTEKQEKFAAGLYGILSVDAVHALFAKREYARLMRNVVIEYGVMFLSMMSEQGIKVDS